MMCSYHSDAAGDHNDYTIITVIIVNIHYRCYQYFFIVIIIITIIFNSSIIIIILLL